MIVIPHSLYPVAGSLLGLIIGSFLATIVVRWPLGQSVISGRSRCDQCERTLHGFELIPVFSHVFLDGKCRSCGSAIKTDHLAIELAAGFIGGIALYIFPNITGLFGAIFGWLLLTLAVLDLEHQWLPDKLTFALAVTGLLSSLFVSEPDITSRIIGGLSGFLSLFLVSRAYKLVRRREGLGGGDPKMLGAIGCWTGWAVLPIILFGAALAGIIAALIMKARGEKVTGTSALPLGSFMAITAFPIWLYLTASAGLRISL